MPPALFTAGKHAAERLNAPSDTCAIILGMDPLSPAEAPAAPPLRDRSDIPDRFKWNLAHIFPDWATWQQAYEELDVKIGAFAALQGSLAKGADRLLAAYRLRDE